MVVVSVWICHVGPRSERIAITTENVRAVYVLEVNAFIGVSQKKTVEPGGIVISAPVEIACTESVVQTAKTSVREHVSAGDIATKMNVYCRTVGAAVTVRRATADDRVGSPPPTQTRR